MVHGFEIVISGLISTLAMEMVMRLTTGMKLANADMVRALGSLVTREYRTALLPGLLLHVVFGVVFAFFYASVVSFSPAHTSASIILITTILSIFHGLAFGVLLVILVAEHHPLPMFRTVGLRVVLAHLAGHVTYGFCLGLMFVFTRLQFTH
ncbi:MAG: hypothetical protein H7222_14325 [Methylotenera sp.]|nr:hypothetical protein [Oligoflexia bacterium]